ncbi:hypothetical protein [Spiroplasma endosymbiont of Asaphidion curtum]|uniref:hypothetical protein n=1 Tax=Spiroplasma endosymbiont of Asaphidion curtum TaxID=3066281 RepID=UPI00313DF358
MLLKELWPNITINGYHTIKPLTGTLDAIPSKYKDLNFANFDDWFKTFALRAQNDCNMYLDFIFNKWEFTTFPDEIKETVMDMIYILIEHWVFNRVPVEFFVNATNNLNTSSTSYIAYTLANNTQDMIPQRAKALANFTELKNFLIPYNDENTIDANMIDLGLYYSKFVVDKLLEKEKNERIEVDNELSKAVHDEKIDRIVGDRLNDSFTLKKQLKFFQSRCQDYTCPQNPNLIGPVTNLVIEEYASSDYEHETETLTVSFPKQIGTLPPNALQPNPQEGDYTHATTADFSAKLQKQLNNIVQKLPKNEILLVNEELENSEGKYSLARFNIANYTFCQLSIGYKYEYVQEWEKELVITTPLLNVINDKFIFFGEQYRAFDSGTISFEVIIALKNNQMVVTNRGLSSHSSKEYVPVKKITLKQIILIKY